MRPFSVVLLAAGESTRLGRPKQLLEIGDQPLIHLAVNAALVAEPQEVIVVLGAYAGEVQAAAIENRKPQIESPAVRFVMNDGWQEGMGSSLRAGVAAIDPASEAIVVMLCDQPYVTGQLLLGLVGALGHGSDVAATEYEGRASAPCAFLRSMLPDLLSLRGDQGAREIIRDPSRNVALVPFDTASLDIDTEGDLSTWAALSMDAGKRNI